MEKLKVDKLGINQLIDVRTIEADGREVSLTATQVERNAVAERFELPAVHALSVVGHLSWEEDMVVFDGTIQADIEQTCVVSLEPFRRTYTYPFRVLFSTEASEKEASFDASADIIEPINRGKINLGDVITEEFGVHLDAFPKKEDVPFEYRDADDAGEAVDSPFAVLKNLTNRS